MHEPSLTRLNPPAAPRGVVLMLHGGKQHSLAPVDGRSASWRRSAAMQRAIGGAAQADDVAVWLLRFRHRGWNEMASREPSPLPDARWALEEVRRVLGEVPVVLLGHSMGARTAAQVADHPSVRGVVGLAPWFAAEDDVAALRDRHLVAAHGSTDKITSARATRRFVDRAAAVAASTEFVDMGRVGHYLLRRTAQWNDLALSRSLAMLGR